jgi:iron complex transport system ATP-binding protein
LGFSSALLTALNHERGVTMVLATHDLNLAASVCRRLVLMRSGRVIAQGSTTEVLTPAHIRDLYGVDAEVHAHSAAGHLTVVPLRRT